MELAISVGKYTAACQGMYWGFRTVSPMVVPFWSSLDDEKGEKGYFAASCVSTVFAVGIIGLSLRAISQEPTFLSSADFFQSTELSLMSCRFFMGYTLSDLLLALWYGKRWAGFEANLFHHVAVLLCWWQLTSGHYAQGIALVLMACEISSPFVNARWMLDKAGMKTSTIYMANGLAMLGSFFVGRIACYGAQVFRIFQQRVGLSSIPTINMCIFLGCYFSGFVLQSFWFSKILKGAIKALSGKPAIKSNESYDPV